MQAKLSEIFIQKANKIRYTKTTLLLLDIKTEFCMSLAKYLSLTYEEKGSGTGNLCYAQTADIRSGYREFFTEWDIRAYLDKVLEPGNYNLESGIVEFPKSMDF
ncbi:MAG: hypothetical protein NXH90_10910 [Flavobacteriaceae bacterium]|nr:hypothetical protein [Flavobacteriaceae bacterium]